MVRSTSRRATRAGTNFSSYSVDRAAGSIMGRGTGTHRWPCGQPCGPRALRGTREGHGGSRSAGKSRRQIERGGFVNNRHLWLKSMRARGDLNLNSARVRVRSRRYSLAATAHFMERDMQAILCVVDTGYATGVVCDYAPPRASPHPENTRRNSRLASWIDCSSKIRRSDWLSSALKSLLLGDSMGTGLVKRWSKSSGKNEDP